MYMLCFHFPPHFRPHSFGAAQADLDNLCTNPALSDCDPECTSLNHGHNLDENLRIRFTLE